MTLTDAGALVALVDSTQALNTRCRAAFSALNLPLLTTWPAYAEAIYLLGRIGGWPLQYNLWQYLDDGTLVIHASSVDEQRRMRVLMEQYPLPNVSAGVVQCDFFNRPVGVKIEAGKSSRLRLVPQRYCRRRFPTHLHLQVIANAFPHTTRHP